jgi:hypothetical protein
MRSNRDAASRRSERTPSAMPIAAATPIAGAPRITISLMARATSVVGVDAVDFARREQALIDHHHASVVPLDGADAGSTRLRHGHDLFSQWGLRPRL